MGGGALTDTKQLGNWFQIPDDEFMIISARTGPVKKLSTELGTTSGHKGALTLGSSPRMPSRTVIAADFRGGTRPGRRAELVGQIPIGTGLL